MINKQISIKTVVKILKLKFFTFIVFFSKIKYWINKLIKVPLIITFKLSNKLWLTGKKILVKKHGKAS